MGNEIGEFIRDLRRQTKLSVERTLGDRFYLAQMEDLQLDETFQIYLIKATRLHDGQPVEKIRLVGQGLGNLKGSIKYPQKEEIGLVLDVFGEPFWLGNVFDIYTDTPDTAIQLKEGWIMQNKEGGAFLLLSKDDNVNIVTQSGAKMQLKTDGSFKLYNKDNYGYECDASGNVTIRGVTVSFTQTPGSFTVI